MFSKNIRHLRKLHGLTQEQLADEIGVTRSRIGSYEENRSEPPIELLIQISDYFKVPIDILIRNDLSKSKGKSFIDIGRQRILFPIAVDEDDRDLIEIVPIKASAGYLDGYSDPEYIQQLEKISLPFLSDQKHRAFPIKGDSMIPLKEGSIVVAKFIEELNEIIDGRTYIVLTANEGIVYKRVYNQIKKNKTLLLVSDNTFYAPYEIPAEDVLEIWEFASSIRMEEFDQEELKIASIQASLDRIQGELKGVTSGKKKK